MKRINNRTWGLGFLTLLAGLALTSCEEDTDGTPRVEVGNPVATQIMPDSAAGGSTVTLLGTGLGDIRTIMFEKQEVPALSAHPQHRQSADLSGTLGGCG